MAPSGALAVHFALSLAAWHDVQASRTASPNASNFAGRSVRGDKVGDASVGVRNGIGVRHQRCRLQFYHGGWSARM